MDRLEDGHGEVNAINFQRVRISPVVSGCVVLCVVSFQGTVGVFFCAFCSLISVLLK